MATIASAKSSNGKYKVWIEYSYTQNKTANTSSVTGTGYIQRADGYNGASAYNLDKKGYIKIGGTQYNGPEGIDTRYLKKAKLGSGTKTITHNSSTGAATCAFVVYCPYLASSCPATTGSGTLTLPTIPRTPTLNSTDVIEVYSTSIVINWTSSMSVNMVRYSTKIHSLCKSPRLCFKSLVFFEKPGICDNVSIHIVAYDANSISRQCPNDNQLDCPAFDVFLLVPKWESKSCF